MGSLGRNPVLVAGLVVAVVGLGNWVVGYRKLADFATRPAPTHEQRPQVAGGPDFPDLTPLMNRTLLKRLVHGAAESAALDTKKDFYEIVRSGGRLLCVLGLLIATGAAAFQWVTRGRPGVERQPNHGDFL